MGEGDPGVTSRPAGENPSPANGRSARKLAPLRRRSGWAMAALLAAVLLPSAGAASLAPDPETESPWPPTGAEAAGWVRATTHAEVVAFLEEVDRASDQVVVRNLGYSDQGRTLPAVFMGAPPPVSPGGGAHGDRPTILVLGATHGNERSGKEGGLQFIRELALGEGRELLERVNVIVVPLLNPDGSAVARRENSRGYDLNRDWIVAETPEVSAVLEQLVLPYRPDVFVDVHNGGSYPYHLTWQATLDPSADPDLVALARGPMYEAVRSHLRDREMSMYWYSGPAWDEDAGTWYWRTTEPLPRKQHSYGGLQDMVALLFEVPGRHAPEVGAAAVREGLLALTRFVADEGEAVRSVVEEARRRTRLAGPGVVHLELAPAPRPGIELFHVLRPAPEGNGEVSVLVSGEDRTLYLPVRSRPAPWAYAIEPGLHGVVALLARHGIEVETLDTALEVWVEGYGVAGFSREPVAYQNHRMLDISVELRPGRVVTLPQGTHLVRTAQPGGRLAAQLLEPDAVDSVVRWNFLDGPVERAARTGGELPIVRLPDPLAD